MEIMAALFMGGGEVGEIMSVKVLTKYKALIIFSTNFQNCYLFGGCISTPTSSKNKLRQATKTGHKNKINRKIRFSKGRRQSSK